MTDEQMGDAGTAAGGNAATDERASGEMGERFAFTARRGKRKVAEPQVLPALGGAPLIDTHAHLDMLDDPALALARAAVAGLTGVVTIADVSEDAERSYRELAGWQAQAQALLDDYARQLPAEAQEQAQVPPLCVPRVGIIVGMHPHNARHFDDAAEASLHKVAADSRTVGLGELGLDYHYDHSPRERQRAVFARQLALAQELNLPVTIHLREAHADGLALLQELGLPAPGAILHCFNLEPEVAAPFLELGCVVSFAGPVTFKKAEEVRAAAAAVPLDRLLVETDCPFMAPEPFRGQRAEPAHTLWNAAAVATARGLSLPEVAAASTATAERLFGW